MLRPGADTGDPHVEMVFDDADGVRHALDIVARKPQLVLDVDGRPFALEELSTGDPARIRIRVGNEVSEGWRWVSGQDVYLRVAGRHWHFRRAASGAGESSASASRAELCADMPGTVVSVHVAVGVEVLEGDRLMTIESMKLQMTVTAPRAARVRAIHVAENATFDRGVTLISFEPESVAGGEGPA